MSLFRKFTFHGGVHPDDGKELSADCTIETMPPPATVFIPLVQHIGAPAHDVVGIG
ncbi:MAG: hypothetical protein KBA26_03690, partial [Candidatus Delongbacteria bacterium]|nr:hypothetical protein [Candidatus Delongbacteria bacterium]